MTRYLDSSAIIKLYIDEVDSDRVRADVAASDVIATATVAYAEVRAAFGRLRRERRISRATATALVRQFDIDWPAFLTIDVNETLSRDAGAIADRLNLRGFDSIHLAAFARLCTQCEDELEFVAFDDRLTRAARKLA